MSDCSKLTLRSIFHIITSLSNFYKNLKLLFFTCNFHFDGDDDGVGDGDVERLARAHIIQDNQPSHVMYAHRDPGKDCPTVHLGGVYHCTILYTACTGYMALSCNILAYLSILGGDGGLSCGGIDQRPES